jgi:hypothetical protein
MELMVKASAPLPPPKKPDSPLAQSLMLLGGVSPHTLNDKPAGGLWTPQEQELFLPTQDIGGSLPNLRSRQQPPAKQLTPFEQVALLGKAVQSIPETISDLADAIQGVPKAVTELGVGLRTLGITIGRGLDWLDRYLPRGPLDPYGRPVPRWNVQLYLLAERAYQGDLEARVRFLDAIGAENATDTPTYVEALLRPTFDPRPQDLAGRRGAWEQSPPDVAREWLRKRLRSLRYQQEAPHNGRVNAGDIEHLLQAPAHPETNPELWAFYQSEVEMWRKKIAEILPPKQYEVFLLMEKGLPTHEIARARGKAPGTIKKQVWEIRNNPRLRAAGEQLREELWWGRPAWE